MVSATHASSAATGTAEGGAHTSSVRVEIPGRPRAGESAETERDCREGDDPSGAPRASAGPQEGRRDQKRGRATAEEPLEPKGGEDGQQHSHGAERVAEEGGGLGRD